MVTGTTDKDMSPWLTALDARQARPCAVNFYIVTNGILATTPKR